MLVVRFSVLLCLAGMLLLSGGSCSEDTSGPEPDPQPIPPDWTFRTLAVHPHDPEAFTQGLAWYDGSLYEGTGRHGSSSLRRVELTTGEVLQSVPLAVEYFGEGIAVMGDRIAQITWRTEVGFVYDRETFALLDTFEYEGQGWGLCWDGERLIMSDGSDSLRFLDPDTFAEIGGVKVKDEGVPVARLNELEFIGEHVYANIYQTDTIARIDPATGELVARIDCTGLDQDQQPGQDVLNGIAHDPDTGRTWLTGKYWPSLYEVEFLPIADDDPVPWVARAIDG